MTAHNPCLVAGRLPYSGETLLLILSPQNSIWMSVGCKGLPEAGQTPYSLPFCREAKPCPQASESPPAHSCHPTFGWNLGKDRIANGQHPAIFFPSWSWHKILLFEKKPCMWHSLYFACWLQCTISLFSWNHEAKSWRETEMPRWLLGKGSLWRYTKTQSQPRLTERHRDLLSSNTSLTTCFSNEPMQKSNACPPHAAPTPGQEPGARSLEKGGWWLCSSKAKKMGSSCRQSWQGRKGEHRLRGRDCGVWDPAAQPHGHSAPPPCEGGKKTLHLPWMPLHILCWTPRDVHLVAPKIFILLVNTEALKPQQLGIFHKFFGAWSSGPEVSSFLLPHLGEKEAAGTKS